MRKKITLLLAMMMILVVPIVSFAENPEITKAQFLKEVFDEAGIEITTADSSFKPFVEAAWEKGIISEEEKLKVDKPVTKEEAVIILVKVFGERTKIKDITQEMIEKEIQFTDERSITHGAKPYIAYAVKYNMLEKSSKAFYPHMLLTKKASRDMIKDAKSAHEKHFVRAGLSASEMLTEADKRLKELKTYKTNGKMEMNMKMNIEGLPAEGEIEQQLGKNMNMDMDIQMDMQTENPDKIYIKQASKSNVEGLGTEEVTEIFMDEETMYQRMGFTGDKWIKTDMSLAHNQIQSLQGNSPKDMAVLEDKELEIFKDYTGYGMDEIIDGKEYYVIYMDIDKETHKKFIEEYIDMMVDISLQQQEQINAIKDEEESPNDSTKQAIEQMFEKMDIESSYKIYIDKDTMVYKKMNVSQTIYMNMDNFIQMLGKLNEEGDADLPDIKLEMIANQEGEFNYYDFNAEVVFPQIKADDIFELKE